MVDCSLKKGDLARCDRGRVGILTYSHPLAVVDLDGKESQAYVGTHIWPPEYSGQPWRSKWPTRVCCDKWDFRFLMLAREVAGWSKDPSTKTGAVIVRPDRTVLSLGYNGFPRGMPDFATFYENREEKYSRIIHCEMNAILSSHESASGCTLYTWPFLSCDRCAVHVAQAGIKRAVAPMLPEELKERWEQPLSKTRKYFDGCAVARLEVDLG